MWGQPRYPWTIHVPHISPHLNSETKSPRWNAGWSNYKWGLEDSNVGSATWILLWDWHVLDHNDDGLLLSTMPKGYALDDSSHWSKRTEWISVQFVKLTSSLKHLTFLDKRTAVSKG